MILVLLIWNLKSGIFMIAKTLGHYRVGEQLGRGGMGEVYVADDFNLNRKVALKFLPDAFTGDPERMARFEREAKLLASLNHPNIAAIHGCKMKTGNRETYRSEAIMMKKPESIRFLLLLAGMMAICMAGNLPADQGDRGKDWEQLRQLAPNTNLKVVLNDASAIRGKWLSADETSITLNVGGTQRRVRRDDVLRVYRQRGGRLRHALIGAGIGAGGGLAAGAIVDARQKSGSWFPNAGKQVLTPLGVIIGGIVGAVLPTRPSQEIYHAPGLAAI